MWRVQLSSATKASLWHFEFWWQEGQTGISGARVAPRYCLCSRLVLGSTALQSPKLRVSCGSGTRKMCAALEPRLHMPLPWCSALRPHLWIGVGSMASWQRWLGICWRRGKRHDERWVQMGQVATDG